MRVAVVHYHYRPGGVTRVVENAFESLRGQDVTAIAICGEPYQGSRLPVRMQPGLGYSRPNEKLFPGPLWYSLRMAARQALGGEPDVWHFHNPALGKNSAMAEVVAKMAADAPVLLQFHDFAEDGRPANYAMLRGLMENMGRLYPQGSQVHYAAINARDHRFLCESGFRRENVHLLPNPVQVPAAALAEQGRRPAGADGAGAASADAAGAADLAADIIAGADGRELYLYPTRAIRRKNLGEFLLWAALSQGAGEEKLFATSLLPENPSALPVYERWVEFAARLKLPTAFGVGHGKRAPSFEALMARASAAVTTSVTEGFGMAFLEPCLFGKPVLGRNLPEITADFAQQGIDLAGLYGRLLVPEGLLNFLELSQKVADKLERTYKAYGRQLPKGAAERAMKAISDDRGRVDFGCLDEALQEQVITALADSPGLRSEIRPLQLEPEQTAAGRQEQIDRNRRAIEKNFGLEEYGSKLAAIYKRVASSPREPLSYADPDKLLDKFLAPERFSLLRTPE